jgi:hypothetical protein
MIWGEISDNLCALMQHPIHQGILVHAEAANTLGIPVPFRIPSWNALFAARTGGPDDDDDDEAALIRKLMPIVAIIIVIATVFGG